MTTGKPAQTQFNDGHTPPICGVFVYGTLKRGQCRAHCWPHPPRRVTAAWTRGLLYDLGPYPALLPGAERILGELWEFDSADMAETLRVLDEVEDAAVREETPGGNLYQRRVLECQCSDGRQATAFAYFFADTERVRQLAPMAAGPDGFCRWPS